MIDAPRPGTVLSALTGARFIAALIVLAYHLVRFDRWDIQPALAHVASLGPVAVTFFFVLSGFVLTWACVDEHGRVPSLRGYFAARLARLLPMHVVSLVVVAPIAIGLWRRALTDLARAHGDVGPDFLHGVALPGLLTAIGLQAWHPSTALAWNPPAWSLSVEVAFYALFPMTAARLLPRPTRVVVVFAAVLWAFALAPGLAALAVDRARFDVGPASHGFLVDAWRYHPLLRLPEFVAGMAAAKALRAGHALPRSAATLALSTVAFVVGLVASGLLPSMLVHNGLLAPAFAVLVTCAATSNGVGVRVLSSSTLRVLGDASYALYLLHVPILYWIVTVAERRGHLRVLDDAAAAVAAAVFCVAVAVVAHRMIERPTTRALRAVLSRR